MRAVRARWQVGLTRGRAGRGSRQAPGAPSSRGRCHRTHACRPPAQRRALTTRPFAAAGEPGPRPLGKAGPGAIFCVPVDECDLAAAALLRRRAQQHHRTRRSAAVQSTLRPEKRLGERVPTFRGCGWVGWGGVEWGRTASADSEMRLWPQAWPMPGSASYSAHTATTGEPCARTHRSPRSVSSAASGGGPQVGWGAQR